MKMKTKVVISSVFVLGIFMIALPPSVPASEIVVIANTSVPAESLGTDEIQNIFLGKLPKWGDNKIITIVVANDAEVHKSFLKKYVNRTETQFNNVWRQNLFTGKGKQPVKVDSIDELVEYVSKTEGAIGYVSSDKPVSGDVKVLAK